MTRDDAPSRIHLPLAPADQQALLDAGGVACWSEPVEIDTYEAGEPDRYPLFLDRRVYQGSSGRVYPLPMIDHVSHVKRARLWQAIHLENATVRLMLLPELGGRIHIGYDKVAGYDFFYRNNVIKPALVGLAGPWISGGVEFNWPQHHRPATFLPVDSRIQREDDGAVVVWHSDLDPLQRMRGVHGIRLRPESSLIELEARLHNRTDVPQTFLWWANVAARSHERYQSFFPDDVAWVADHARRAVTAFPRADRPYYGVDYPALAAERADADRIDVYSNIPVPTSYMITDTADEFFGGYDHAADAGFVHWADRAISPGKKQWTWGDGAIGRAWDAQLTDDDGPYVELMAGVYTDNQPDFAWLAPGETKTFSQFWFPIHRVGPVRQATTDAAVSLTSHPDGARVGIIATRPVPGAVVTVETAAGVAAQWSADLAPDAPLLRTLPVPEAEVTAIRVRTGAGADLVTWTRRAGTAAEPWVATAPDAAAEIHSSDELNLTAQHLLQYRHPSRSPVPYLQEALRRDPGDTRAATALGAWHLSRGGYASARELLQTAVARLTRRNLNPRDGEAHYLLGLALERTGDHPGADTAFATAAWVHAWRVPATLGRARLALRADRAADALALASAVADVPEAARLRVLALRRLHRDAEAATALAALVEADPLDAATQALAGERIAVEPRALLDVAVEFARAGCFAEALAATADPAAPAPAAFGNPEPMRRLLRAAWFDQAGDEAAAAGERAAAAASDPALAFPAGLDQFDALAAAITAEPGHLVARALRGMWLLDAGRPALALADLRAATAAGTDDPVAWRNLALAVMQTGGSPATADAAYERALMLSDDARLVFERDLLAQVRNLTPAERLALLRERPPLLDARDDLALVHATLLLDVDRVDEAWDLLTGRAFRPFEGGEGRVIAAFDRASCAIARRLLDAGAADDAASLLADGLVPPASLGEGRHPAEPQAERLVLLGDARAARDDLDGAREAWETACAATPLAVAPRPADDADFWIGTAHLRLGEVDRAAAAWTRLEQRAAELEQSPDEADYFATSLPELLVFDVDTAAARRRTATRLRELAGFGRAAGSGRIEG
ncbi:MULTISPECIES: DUF5107 domain-containing protein [unclassified Microbacterium]|uniref:DUF5107 domain-containing protein n=1 Tax=unclassified Microbacterium TaxID=2609290 RepID=UPI00214C5DF0|nr:MULTISPECIES: DUF5107 domain-containing protein [unclassified Microbacterium]MCR2784207.1 DUF5107 domain-containing protein [Microbacterium sp. zg.B96]WIM14962.1 DUF5107 domain-containing protein [Microbacterium sp. zg-B96]